MAQEQDKSQVADHSVRLGESMGVGRGSGEYGVKKFLFDAVLLAVIAMLAYSVFWNYFRSRMEEYMDGEYYAIWNNYVSEMEHFAKISSVIVESSIDKEDMKNLIDRAGSGKGEVRKLEEKILYGKLTTLLADVGGAYGFDQMEVHLPDGTTLMRLGNKLSKNEEPPGYLKAIQDVHESGIPVTMFYSAEDGMSLRYISPLFIDGWVMGSFDISVSLPAYHKYMVRRFSGTGFILFKKELVDSQTQGDQKGRMVECPLPGYYYYAENGTQALDSINDKTLGQLKRAIVEDDSAYSYAWDGNSCYTIHLIPFRNQDGIVAGFFGYHQHSEGLTVQYISFYVFYGLFLILVLLTHASMRIIMGRNALLNNSNMTLHAAMSALSDREVESAGKSRFLEKVMETIPLPIFYKNHGGKFLGCNAAFCAFLGLGKECSRRDEGWEIDDTDLGRVLGEKEKELTGTQKVISFESKVRHGDGTDRDMVFYIAPFADSEQGSKKVIGVMYDATERNRYEENLLKLSLAVENSPASVMITDTGGTIEYVNKKFVDIMGYSKDEAIGQNPAILKSGIHPPGFFDAMWETILGGEEWSGEICNKMKNAGLRWQNILISPIFNTRGAITHFVAIIDDITERRRAAEEMKYALSLAESANRAKSEFIANMSHEIRTPLNAIIGFSELITGSELPPKINEYATKINTAGVLLLDIINNILDISKIEAGKLELDNSRFKLDDVVGGVLSLVQFGVAGKKIVLNLSLDPEVPAELVGDSLRLSQVLNNLMNNAIKFTDSGEILLSVGFEGIENGRAFLTFTVKDTGIGLMPEQIENLFKPFTQADGSTTRKYGGTGLGLSISKRLIEIMGGSIGVESEPGKGSSFFFKVGFGMVPQEDTPKYPEGFNELRVLVADGNRRNLGLIMGYMERMSIAATGVGSAGEVIEELKRGDGRKPYDLLVIDCRVSGEDGVSAIDKVRGDGSLRAKPKIIAMSSQCCEKAPSHSAEAGIDICLRKPFTVTMFSEAISKLSEVKKKERAAESPAGSKCEYDFTGVNILLVEDNIINQMLAVEILKKTGAAVDVACNGQEAVEMALSGGKTYDVILMDIQMPVMDGYKATSILRGNAPSAEIPIIALTAHAFDEEREKMMAAGMNAHVSKPIMPKVLFSTIAGFIQTR